MQGTLLALAREIAADERLPALELAGGAVREELEKDLVLAGESMERIRELIDSAFTTALVR